MKRIYLAGPLFSEAHRMWAKKVKKEIEKDQKFSVYWPGEDKIDDIENISQHIFESCSKALDDCEILVAILDGAQIDDGTAWEIGYFYGKGKRDIIGIRTDFRQAGETESSLMNAMIEKSCKEIIYDESSSDALTELIKIIKRV